MDFRFDKHEQELWDWVDGYLRNELPPGWTDDQVIWPGGYGDYIAI